MDLLLSLAVLLLPLSWVMAAQVKWRGSFSLAGAIVVYFVVQLAISLVLGAAGWLRPNAVLIAGLLVVGWGGGLWWSRQAGASAPLGGSGDRAARDPWMALAVGCVVVLFGTGAWFALSLPVTNFDSLAYHLPSLAHWVQTGSLQTVDHLGLQRCFPLSSIALSVPAASVAHADLPVSLLGLLAPAMLAAAAFRLARSLGARSAPAMAVVVLTLSTPVVMRSFEGVQADLLLAALFTTALSEWIAYTRSQGEGHFAAAALAACMLPGVKITGVAYAALLLLFAIATGRGRTRSLRAALGRVRTMGGSLVAATGLGIAGFWYVRAWIACGAPVSLGGGGVEGTPANVGGWSPVEILRTTVAGAFRPGVGEDWIMLGRVLVDAVGLPFLLLTAIGLAGLAVHRVRTESSSTRVPLASCLFLALACLIVYLLTPFSADNGGHGLRLTLWSAGAVRYALPLLALIAALAAAGASVFGRGRELASGLAVVATVVGLRSESSLAWVDVLASLGLLLVVAIAWLRVPTLRPPAGSALALLLVILGISALVAAPQRERLRARAYGPFFARIQENVPAGQPVAFHAIERPYPLYGPDLRRPVVGWPSPDRGRRLWQEDREAWRAEARRWLDSLQAHGVVHLVTRDRDPMPRWDGRGVELTRILRDDPHWRQRMASEDASYLSLFVRSED